MSAPTPRVASGAGLGVHALPTLLLAWLALAACDGTAAGTAPATSGIPQPAAVASPAPTPPPVAAATPASPTVAATPVAHGDPCRAGTLCVLNPAVTQATITITICRRGWSASVRPSEGYTESLKRSQLAAEGLPGPLRDYEEDHRMPIDLGGDPRDPRNLSPERGASPNPKDADEIALNHRVCDGQLSLRDAQFQLASKWLGAWPRYLR